MDIFSRFYFLKMNFRGKKLKNQLTASNKFPVNHGTKILTEITCKMFFFLKSLWKELDIPLNVSCYKQKADFSWFLFLFSINGQKRVKSEFLTKFVAITAGIYLLKVNNKNTRTRCEICSQWKRHWSRSGVFIVNFEHISHLVWCLYC